MTEENTDTSIISELWSRKSLEKALRYLETINVQLHLMEPVAQDEFSHDIIIPLNEESRFLVLGVT